MNICIECEKHFPLDELTHVRTLDVDGIPRYHWICDDCRQLADVAERSSHHLTDDSPHTP